VTRADPARGSRAVSPTFAAAAGAAALALAGCPVAPPDTCAAKATCSASAGDSTGGGVEADAAAGIEPSDAARPAIDSGGGAVDVLVGSDAANDANAPSICPLDHQCAEPGPTGWYWGLAVWTSGGGAPPPPCPPNFGRPYDMLGGFNAPDAICTSTCLATGQACSTMVSIHTDSTCMSAHTVVADVAEATCTNVVAGTQGTLIADVRAPSGGACTPHVSTTLPPVTWTSVARMCIAQTPAVAGGCPNPSALCVPSPALPYASQLCIAEVSSPGQPIPTSCPPDYPNGPSLYYPSTAGTTDDRGCSAASCAGTSPTGGRCEGTIAVTGSLSSDCATGGFTYAIGSGCSPPFQLDSPLAHVQASYAATPGSCPVATPSSAVGSALPAGPPNVVCCK